MRLSQSLIAFTAFLCAALLSYVGAIWAVQAIETRSVAAVRHVLSVEGLEWAHVNVDGLQVKLTGTAPTEAERFHAISTAGSVVDATRIHDEMLVTPAADIAPPRFSVELLRNDEGISLIGLVPSSTGHDAIANRVKSLAPPGAVTDMLETADYAPPEGWKRALAYGLDALAALPHSKISIAADKVTITANADSPTEKRKFESDLARNVPEGLDVALNISAPRPVISPFTTRFLIDAQGARFDACSADTEKTRDRILSAAVAAGAQGKLSCTIGLGVPSPNWADAVTQGIAAVKELGQGSITFSDADVSLLASENTSQAVFDRVIGELGANLPEVFSLEASLPKKQKASVNDGPVEFTATLNPSGQVDLRGRLTDQLERDAVDSFARAKFGAAKVYTATRLDNQLPDGWPVRVLAALDALAELHQGSILVHTDKVEVSGVSGSQTARDDISRILSGKLGQGQAFSISVTYDKKFDPLASLPTPEECVAAINAVMAKSKIAFDPGSGKIAPGASETLDKIADQLKKCPDVPMEVGGYTDSQGRPEMNLALSQSRAESVIQALLTRRILVGNLTAKGYGEANPIADNGTEAGREANRRIEFKLAVPSANGAADAAASAPGSPDAAANDNPSPQDPSAGDGAASEGSAMDAGAPDTAGGTDSDAGPEQAPADQNAAPAEPSSQSFAPATITTRPKRRPDSN